MAKSLTSEIIKLKNARLSFPRLDKPKAFQEGQTPRFEATFLLDPSDAEHAEQIKMIRSAAMALLKAKWTDKPAGLKLCYGFANENPVKAKYDGYPDMFYITTANTTKPTVVNRSRELVVAGQTEFPYGGCRVNTNITLWTQDNGFGKAIRGNLRIVQFYANDKAFSGAAPPNAEDEFEAYGDAKKSSGAVPAGDDDIEL